MKEVDWSSIKSILAIHTSDQTDLAIVNSVLEKVKRAFPRVGITLMLFSTANLTTSLCVDEVWMHKDFPSSSEDLLELVEIIQSAEFDICFIFNSPLQSPFFLGYACYLAHIPIRISLSEEFGGAVLSHWVKPLSQRESSPYENFSLLLNATGFSEQRACL